MMMSPKALKMALHRKKEILRSMAGLPVKTPATTLSRWKKLVEGLPRKDWEKALAPRRTGGGRAAEIHPEAWDAFCALYLNLAAPPASDCYRRVEEQAQWRGWEKLPSLKTFLRKVKREFKAEEIVLLREGKQALDKLYPAIKRSVSHFEPLQWINADGWPVDVFVKHPKTGKVMAHPKLWVWQDVATRRPLSWLLDVSENTDQIRRSFGRLIQDYGIWCGEDGPHIVIDNTRAAANKTMTGGVAHRYRFAGKENEADGILKAMGFELHWTTVDEWGGRGQAKPVERLFEELGDKILSNPKARGAHTGKSPVTKPENYGDKALEWDDLREIIDTEMKRILHQSGRRMEIANGCSIAEAWDKHYQMADDRGHIREVSPQEINFFLLAQQVRKPAMKDGAVTIEGNVYWSNLLIPYRGKEVIVRYNPEDLESSVFIYTKKNKLIGEAELRGSVKFDSTEAARESRRGRKKLQKLTKETAELKKRMAHEELLKLFPQSGELSTAGLPADMPLYIPKREEIPLLPMLPDESAFDDPDELDLEDYHRGVANL